MSAAAVLSGLLGAGVTVEGGADRVRLVEPRPGLLRPEHGPAVRALKPALARLATGGWRLDLAGWPAWRLEAFEERAAIREYDGQQPHDLAERCAYLEAAELPEPVDDPDLDTQPDPVEDIEAAPAGTSTTAEAPAPRPSWAQLARHEAPGPELPPDVDPADPAAPFPFGHIEAPTPALAAGAALESTADPAPFEAPELPAHLADTPEAWAAFLDSAPWIGLSERARILADAAF